MAMVAAVAAIFIMMWFTFTRIKLIYENAATAATEQLRHNHGWQTVADEGHDSIKYRKDAVIGVGTVLAIQG